MVQKVSYSQFLITNFGSDGTGLLTCLGPYEHSQLRLYTDSFPMAKVR
jgi:hypothetical protein